MSELDRVKQMHRDAREADRQADEVMYFPGTRTIGSSSSSDPDEPIRVTKADGDLFSHRRK